MKEPATWKKNQRPNLGGWIMASVLVAVFSVFGQAIALNESAQPADNEQAQPARNLNEHFRGKYLFARTGYVRSSIRKTENGPKGKLTLTGVKIMFDNVPAIAGEHGSARGIAMAFLSEEAAVFGITDMNEIRDMKLIYTRETIHADILQSIH